MNNLATEVLFKIYSYLLPSCIWRVSICSKHLLSITNEHRELWLHYFHEVFPDESKFLSLVTSGKIQRLAFQGTEAVEDGRMDLQMARALEALHSVSVVSTRQIDHSDLRRMEGHAACKLLGRYGMVVAGWGEGGVNNLLCFDATALPSIDMLHSRTVSVPQFRYGFTVVAAGSEEGEEAFSSQEDITAADATLLNRRLIVFGGCMQGGYTGDVNETYFVDVKFFDGADEVVDNRELIYKTWNTPLRLQCTYTNVESLVEQRDRQAGHTMAGRHSTWGNGQGWDFSSVEGGSWNADYYFPESRGYHSAVVVQIHNRQSMVVFGGLHDQAPTADLEVFDVVHMEWRQERVVGRPPSPRFGHSCQVLHPRGRSCNQEYERCKARLIFSGGSDGNDLWRNGRDLSDIHVLSILSKPPSDGAPRDMLVWSTLDLTGLKDLVPLRCHTACSVGENQVIYFGGGGVNPTNAFSALRIDEDRVLPTSFTSKRSVGLRSPEDNPLERQLKPQLQRLTVDRRILKPDCPVFADGAKSVSISSTTSTTGLKTRTRTSSGTTSISSGGSNLPVATEMVRPILSRCSAVGIRFGRFWVLYGGFNRRHGELGDMWMIDLAHRTTDRYLLNRVSRDGVDLWAESIPFSEAGPDSDSFLRNTRQRRQTVYEDDDDDEVDYGEAAQMSPVADNVMVALLRHLFGAQGMALDVAGEGLGDEDSEEMLLRGGNNDALRDFVMNYDEESEDDDDSEDSNQPWDD